MEVCVHEWVSGWDIGRETDGEKYELEPASMSVHINSSMAYTIAYLKQVSGETDEQRAVEAYDVISRACACISKQPTPKGQKKGARELALARPEEVVAVANQNLGIFLYEQVVKRFEKEDASVAVLQV
jgi:hypothetical protein